MSTKAITQNAPQAKIDKFAQHACSRGPGAQRPPAKKFLKIRGSEIMKCEFWKSNYNN
jgi:hypothetical protein